MKIRSIFPIVLILLAVGLAEVEVAAQDTIFAPFKEVIKAGNSKDMVKFLNQSVDMNLDGEVNTFSKAQAEFALRDFFKKHPPKDFSIVHTGSSKGGLQFAIGRYLSNGESYSALIRVKEVEEAYLIHEINFVKE
jgi:Domain of unknown function (DUF4783)